ncbi:hypothetical protein RMSM_01219 [Rhodopirellula maiorica SM1]|uniref:Uncharacterized protein n=1 Tax=Rhodopirellula maiorica SM1 TaxID=1265738 RepID=M5S6P6_9BACT|nr:hypothetical protein RMSM_01219 [Rhodopirellula maiorica SM1]
MRSRVFDFFRCFQKQAAIRVYFDSRELGPALLFSIFRWISAAKHLCWHQLPVSFGFRHVPAPFMFLPQPSVAFF